MWDRPEAHAAMAFLAGEPEFVDPFGSEFAAAGMIPAMLTYDQGFADEDTAAWASMYYSALAAGNAGFDGSDMLPEPVRDALYEGLLEYVSAPKPDLDAILLTIEMAWPEET